MVPCFCFDNGFPRRYIVTSAGFLFFSLLISFWTGTPELSTAIRSYNAYMPASESETAASSEHEFQTFSTANASSGLRDDFYALSCPLLETIITETVTLNLLRDRSLSAGLLRMAFHDCFVQGCDASVLLISNLNGGPPERDAFPNQHSLRGFEVLDEIKNNIELSCPNTVSCADIVVLAAREVVAQVGGPSYSLPKGRRDSKTSSKEVAEIELPQPNFDISQMKQSFRRRRLNETDLVSLLGSHTLGLANCTFLSSRLYNYSNGMPDARLNISLFYNLTKACPRLPSVTKNVSRVPLDPDSSQIFDNSYYKNLVIGRGLLGVDQALMDDPLTSRLVHSYSDNQALFFQDFQRAMIKLSNLAVLSGGKGEIRKNCSVVNR